MPRRLPVHRSSKVLARARIQYVEPGYVLYLPPPFTTTETSDRSQTYHSRPWFKRFDGMLLLHPQRNTRAAARCGCRLHRQPRNLKNSHRTRRRRPSNCCPFSSKNPFRFCRWECEEGEPLQIISSIFRCPRDPSCRLRWMFRRSCSAFKQRGWTLTCLSFSAREASEGAKCMRSTEQQIISTYLSQVIGHFCCPPVSKISRTRLHREKLS
ncbi:hypothetical protein B0H14DRAFT_2827603 [Mycena olivaceomarginata]|nr:hypothetical protein B0H14DRAFT_2827603 [Mycena olivaceomarginata]